jgi:hypothetical protein
VIASGLVVIVIVVMGIGLGVGLAMRGSSEQPSNQSGLPTGRPTVVMPSPSASPSLMPSPTPTEGVLGMDYISQPCYVDEVNMLPLGQTPRATHVSTVQGGRSVEVATKAGPFAAMDRTNLSYCYSHTVEGAITAGANFLLHSTWDTERRDSIAMDLADNSDGTLAGKVFDSSRSKSGVYAMQQAHITGYYYEIRDENNVLVVYTFTLGDDPKTLTMPLRMTWVKDWKVVYPETPDAWGIGELTDEAKTRITPWSVN